MATSVKPPIHPKTAAAAKVAATVASLFTLLAVVGVIVPSDAQNAVTVLAVDVATLLPVAAAYVKKASS